MRRSKTYSDAMLPVQGWKRLIDEATRTFPDLKFRSAVAKHDGGAWEFDSLADFLAHQQVANSDVDFDSADNTLRFVLEARSTPTARYWDLHWSLRANDKARLVSFEHEADQIVATLLVSPPPLPPEPVESIKPPTIFIGHGGRPDWKELKDHLVEKHGYNVEAYEMGSRAGHTIRDILDSMLGRSDLAILVHTPENKREDGSADPRSNVIHETGLFQARLGWDRAVIVQKAGTNDFSNVAGIQQIRYATRISEIFGDVLAWIARESKSR